MKKIKLKSLVDANNIDDIYNDICKELNLNKETKASKQTKSDKVLNSLLSSSKAPTKKVKDEDLLLSMTKRLNLVETKLKESQNIIRQKDIEIEKLKKQIEKYTEEKNCSNCEMLQTQLDKQGEFITKLYTFIESKGISTDHIEDKIKENDEDYDLNTLPRTIDIKTLMRRVDEMNGIIYEEGTSSANFVSEDGKVFKLQPRKEISITFFKNGIVIEGYQFFSYSSTTGQKILQDIIDGYSPFILKERYPNGVIMKPVNSIHIEHNEDKEIIKGCADTGEKKKISGEEFVKMFPEKVIKNGNIHNIREDMKKILNLVAPNEEKEIKEENDKDNFDLCDKGKVNEKDIAKIKIQITMLNKSINVSIEKNKNIKTLFDFVQKYTNDNLSKLSLTMKIKTMSDYCFLMTYPYKLITYDTNSTVSELGLYPSMFITFDTLSKHNSNK